MIGDDTTKAQIDNLGGRLRFGSPSDNDLDGLDAYRQSFEPAYRKVVNMIRLASGDTPTGRPGKSTTSIIAKLNRDYAAITDAGHRRLSVDSR